MEETKVVKDMSVDFTSMKPRRSQTTSSSHGVQKVYLHMSCESITHHGYMGEIIATDIESQTKLITIYLTAQGHVDVDKSKIRDGPIRWPLPDCTCEQRCKKRIVFEILRMMIRQVRSVSPQDNIHELDINCEVSLTHYHFIGDVNNWMMQRACAPRMIPASDSSLESLRRTILVDCDGLDGDPEKCSVCFEDFVEGSEVLCMPCSHLFHRDCIGEWLRASHVCPNCRHEMPTD